ICQVYYNLSFNDGVESPEPLCLSLTSRHTFDAVFNGLLQAVEEGRGLSSLSGWNEYEPEAEEVASVPGKDQEGDAKGSLDETLPQERPKDLNDQVKQEPELPDHAAESVSQQAADYG